MTYKATMAVAGPGRRPCPRGTSGPRRSACAKPAAEAGAFVGEPAEIAGMVMPFLDAGVDHVIVELAGGTRPESIALAAKALAPLMPATGSRG